MLEQSSENQKLIGIKSKAKVSADMLLFLQFGCISISKRKRYAHTFPNWEIQFELGNTDVRGPVGHSLILTQPFVTTSQGEGHLTLVEGVPNEGTLAFAL